MSWVAVAEAEAELPPTPMLRRRLIPLDYLRAPPGPRPVKVLNFAASIGYQSAGYYVSLLAEARGDKVLPSVTTLLELANKRGYAHALPQLDAVLARTMARMVDPPSGRHRLVLCLGRTADRRFTRFAREVFDWFRAPILRVSLAERDGVWRVRRIALGRIEGLSTAEDALLQVALAQGDRSRLQVQARSAPRWSLAVLYDPKEALPPSSPETLDRMARVFAKAGIGVTRIGTGDLTRLAEFDALFIRQTTSVADVTFRFASRAAIENMPVIDDPTSIVRCTNKVYLAERLRAHRLAMPPTRVVSQISDLEPAAAALGLPLVLKIPDGSFSRGVHKAETLADAARIAQDLLTSSDLILAQRFMPTTFDWRVGVLGGEPLFVSQYFMAKKHWQIVRHESGRRAREGGFRTLPVEAAPAEVVALGVAAARLMGDGLYGVDLKETPDGVVVIEVNDNPNLDHDVEGAVLKDRLWQRLAHWFLQRLEAKPGSVSRPEVEHVLEESLR
ncbi:MAG: RimK family alpha-L-glutamate ligase [Geminicoccaceae bacterium]|nr:MAG: RimK family alpha-L-glutamate ligase [Geminicoccaceae bacterium]